jgi:hypothetical protein
MVAVARVFRDVIDGGRSHEDGMHELSRIYPDVPFANGFVHGQAGAVFVAGEAGAGPRIREPQMRDAVQ